MQAEIETKVQVYIPGGFFNRKTVTQVKGLIDITPGMISRSRREIRRMMRKGNAVALVVEQEGKRRVVGFGGITHEFRKRRFGRIQFAEFGALVAAEEYQGNGFGQQVTREMAQRYVDSPVKGLWRTGDFVLFAMAHFDNQISNGMFQRIGGISMDIATLPKKALDEGADYNVYNITHVRPGAN